MSRTARQELFEIKNGMRLVFIRHVVISGIGYRRGRKARVLYVDDHVAILSFPMPLRDANNFQRKDWTFRVHTFRYCLFVDPKDLLEHCREE